MLTLGQLDASATSVDLLVASMMGAVHVLRIGYLERVRAALTRATLTGQVRGFCWLAFMLLASRLFVPLCNQTDALKDFFKHFSPTQVAMLESTTAYGQKY